MKRPISFSEACVKYPHRFTCEHVPAHASDISGDSYRYYAPQYLDDREWYERTIFPGECGLSPRESHCMSSQQTWPMGQWLLAPYNPRVRPAFKAHFYALLLVRACGPVSAKQIQHEIRSQMPDVDTDGKAVVLAAEAITFLVAQRLVTVEDDGTFSPIPLPYEQ